MKNIFVTTVGIVTGFICETAVIFAQSDASSATQSFSGIVDVLIGTLAKSLSGLFISIGVVGFLFGVAKFIWGSREGKVEDIDKGKNFMTWGLVALFVMFSVYGIIKMSQGVLFNDADVTTIKIPDVNIQGGTP